MRDGARGGWGEGECEMVRRGAKGCEEAGLRDGEIVG